MPTVETVVDGLRFPEGPRWHDGALWFSDMHALVVLRVDGATGHTEVVVRVPNQPSGLGWDAEGRLLVVSMRDRRLLRVVDGEAEVVADLSALATSLCNDMVVDRAGRAYIGNFGFDFLAGEAPRGAVLARVDPDGTVVAAADDLRFPNGTVISPDGSTLVVAETFAARLTAFDVDQSDGGLTNRRVWAQLDSGAVPDGICLDAEGAIWVASPTTNEVLRVAEGGRVLDRVATGRGAFACMLGGDDRRTLFVCTAVSSDPAVTAGDASARIEAVAVDVPGAGLP
jgi:sugar lactone lactonase YvrE